jgi:hypothetical protein
LDSTAFDASDIALLQTAAIEKEENAVSPLVVKKRNDDAFKTAETVLTQYNKVFAKVRKNDNS